MQEIHVVSTSIGEIRTKVVTEITPTVQKAHTDIDTTAVPTPGFGLLGSMVFGGAYGDARNHARGILADALTTLAGWDTALGQIERNWRSAEDHSTVVYQ